MDISERDWKLLRKLHDTALQRYCERVVAECRHVLDDTAESAHVRFLQLYDLSHIRNRELARAFDDLRRSTAIDRVVAMRHLGVLTDEDLLAFSPETRAAVQRRETP